MVADEDCTGLYAMLLGDLNNLGVLQERRVGRSEGRVRLGNDSLRLEVLDEVVLWFFRVSELQSRAAALSREIERAGQAAEALQPSSGAASGADSRLT